MNNNDGLAALGFLFLLGVFVGILAANTREPVEFAIVTPNLGIGCRFSSNVPLA